MALNNRKWVMRFARAAIQIFAVNPKLTAAHISTGFVETAMSEVRLLNSAKAVASAVLQ